jgi:hypothetical protein
MKPAPSYIFLSSSLALFAILGGFLQAEPMPNRAPAPLGLVRLHNDTYPGHPATLPTSKFAVDPLAADETSGVKKDKMGGVDFLRLAPGREWWRPLRGPARAISFVSFQLAASQSTIIDLGGARIGLTASTTSGTLQLMFDESLAGKLHWKALNLQAGAAKYGGMTLVALPTLTVRVDPNARTWDLYWAGRMVAAGLPLIAAKIDDRRFVLRAGMEGALITGLVMADENPLYEDANLNGVDDGFERQSRGMLLANNATFANRKLLADEWMRDHRRKAPPALHVRRLAPDTETNALAPRL